MFCRYFRRALLEETPWGAALFKRYFDLVRGSIDRLDAQGKIRPDVVRLWWPFSFMFLQTATQLMDTYIKQILGRSGFEEDLWRRRYRAYGDLIALDFCSKGLTQKKHPRQDGRDVLTPMVRGGPARRRERADCERISSAFAYQGFRTEHPELQAWQNAPSVITVTFSPTLTSRRSDLCRGFLARSIHEGLSRGRRDARKDSVARTGRSTHCLSPYPGSRSSRFMNNPG